MTKASTTKTVARKTSARKSSVPKVGVTKSRLIGQLLASSASCFLPIASFMIAHHEAPQYQYMWVFVVAALLYSAPTLISWANEWTNNTYKAVGWVLLLEGAMIFSHNEYLSYIALVFLALINGYAAFKNFGESSKSKARAAKLVAKV